MSILAVLEAGVTGLLATRPESAGRDIRRLEGNGKGGGPEPASFVVA
ncbi:MAG: hypothetical protein AB7L91_13520 [Dehalococcoidia bacterium]